jgi:hypothetical protein
MRQDSQKIVSRIVEDVEVIRGVDCIRVAQDKKL